MNPIKKIAVTLLAIDVIWATIMATFGARLITQLGLAAGSDPGLSYVSGFSGWIITFLAALFQGGIFLAVGSVFFTIGLVGVSGSAAAINAVLLWCIALSLIHI